MSHVVHKVHEETWRERGFWVVKWWSCGCDSREQITELVTARAHFPIPLLSLPHYCSDSAVAHTHTHTHTLGTTRLFFAMTDSARLKIPPASRCLSCLSCQKRPPLGLSRLVSGASILVTASYPLAGCQDLQPPRVVKISVLTLHFEGTSRRRFNRRPSQKSKKKKRAHVVIARQ
jgi:hypothetical protein